jgi:hypothetical protein
MKKSQNSRNQGFAYYFCLIIEGSGAGSCKNGSGSRKPKNIRVLRIRIRNTVYEATVTYEQLANPEYNSYSQKWKLTLFVRKPSFNVQIHTLLTLPVLCTSVSLRKCEGTVATVTSSSNIPDPGQSFWREKKTLDFFLPNTSEPTASVDLALPVPWQALGSLIDEE